ncbi:MAG: glycosyltransferase family A protein [Fermentimonas sp.]|nr:glycosyltransferase family A protein [Fermentimonas sp.]
MKQTFKNYLQKQKQNFLDGYNNEFQESGIVIVIPCYDEPDLINTLDNITNCDLPDVKVTILVVINSAVKTDLEIVSRNRDTYLELYDYRKKIRDHGIELRFLCLELLPDKHAGVGFARKIGMDLAVDHFYKTDNYNGIIVSLDADCEVSNNFLTSIYDAFKQNEKLKVTIHNFYHRVESDAGNIEYAVRQYEAYLHYYSESLKQIGFPYYYHTIGSAFAVSADAYVRAGGMGRQQGGEDFYFLQKVFPLGEVKFLKDTFVYPLARFSDRVPFGTGPAIQKILDEPDGILKVYSRQSFHELKRFFDLKEFFFKKDDATIISKVSELHPVLIDFLNENEYLKLLRDCNDNCATLKSFVKRFFHNFNAFRIVKYLNYVHPKPFEFEKITTVTDKLKSRV